MTDSREAQIPQGLVVSRSDRRAVHVVLCAVSRAGVDSRTAQRIAVIAQSDGLAQHCDLVGRPVEQAVDIGMLLNRRGRVGGQVQRRAMAQRVEAHGSRA